MSFRSTNSGRSESKTKMLSPRPSHVQDVKSTKEKSSFERQRSFRTDHPSNNSMMGTSVSTSSRIDKKPSFKAESSSLAPATIHHETKIVQTDGKSAALSRSLSLAARKNADVSSSTGRDIIQFFKVILSFEVLFCCFMFLDICLHDQVNLKDHQNIAIVLLWFHQPMELLILNKSIVRIA